MNKEKTFYPIKGEDYYIKAVLWVNKKDFDEALDVHDDTIGMFCPEPYREVEFAGTWVRVFPDHLGTIHLIHCKCTEEIVAHECAHAALFLSKVRSIDPLDPDEKDSEEIFCHDLSNLMVEVYRWMWEVEHNDPLDWEDYK